MRPLHVGAWRTWACHSQMGSKSPRPHRRAEHRVDRQPERALRLAGRAARHRRRQARAWPQAPPAEYDRMSAAELGGLSYDARVVGDDAYAGHPVSQDAASYGIAIQIAAKPADSPGFTPIPLRWRVEAS